MIFQIGLKNRSLASKTIPKGFRSESITLTLIGHIFIVEWGQVDLIGLGDCITLLKFYHFWFLYWFRLSFWSSWQQWDISLCILSWFPIAVEGIQVNISMFDYFIFEGRGWTFLLEDRCASHSPSTAMYPSNLLLFLGEHGVRYVIHLINQVDILANFLIINKSDGMMFSNFGESSQAINIRFLFLFR